MNIKSLLLGSAAALAAACFLPIPDAMASPGAGGGGGGAAIADPWESPAVADPFETQLAELPEYDIKPDGNGMKKPNLLDPQLAQVDIPWPRTQPKI